jgi:hypothetical protein
LSDRKGEDVEELGELPSRRNRLNPDRQN